MFSIVMTIIGLIGFTCVVTAVLYLPIHFTKRKEELWAGRRVYPGPLAFKPGLPVTMLLTVRWTQSDGNQWNVISRYDPEKVVLLPDRDYYEYPDSFKVEQYAYIKQRFGKRFGFPADSGQVQTIDDYGFHYFNAIPRESSHRPPLKLLYKASFYPYFLEDYRKKIHLAINDYQVSFVCRDWQKKEMRRTLKRDLPLICGRIGVYSYPELFGWGRNIIEYRINPAREFGWRLSRRC